MTSTSAHGFLPRLLLFSTIEVHVSPSMSNVSQNLQIVCLIVGDSRIWLFRDVARRSVSR